jgi:hypothetical protein
MAIKLTYTKSEIEAQTVFYIECLGDRGERRDSAAMALGVSRRTIDAWCSPADPRVIPAAQMLQLVTEVTFRQSPGIDYQRMLDIYDSAGDLMATTSKRAIALYIADIARSEIQARQFRGVTRPVTITADELTRSKLRKLVFSNILSKKQICSTLGCDEYVLIGMMTEVARHRYGRMPDAFKLALLETYVGDQVEECA